MNRRDLFKSIGAIGAASMLPSIALACEKKSPHQFIFCLNTSTIKGKDVLEKIDIAGKAGYDGLELWIRDIQAYIENGQSLSDLKKIIVEKGMKVEGAIGFAKCFVDDEQVRADAMKQLKQEMDMMAQLGCKRIAAPPAGVPKEKMPSLFDLGKRYKAMLDLGRETGVMPQLEFWGASETLFHIGQALMVAAVSNDPDARMLPDVYHMFRGGSGYDSLKMLNGNFIEIFHMNDYPSNIPREKQTDADRVYPGDGAAPIKQILTDLKNMGGEKVLSLELFNPDYWEQDQLKVAKTGLMKMKKLVNNI